jgi:hypothetical protein
MSAGDKRIAEIRAKVREERALLVELNGRISGELKRLMKPASHLLDDVEGYFLAPEVLRHPPRLESEMAKWLGNAEIVLARAIEHRKYIEGLIKKHGLDAHMVGGG